MSSPHLGRHMLLELFDCPYATLNSLEDVRSRLLRITDEIGATRVNENFHHFSPQGISGVVIIAESHLTIHTWPEHGYAAVDLFTCDASIDYDLAERLLVGAFKAGRHERQTLARGQMTVVHPA